MHTSLSAAEVCPARDEMVANEGFSKSRLRPLSWFMAKSDIAAPFVIFDMIGSKFTALRGP